MNKTKKLPKFGVGDLVGGSFKGELRTLGRVIDWSYTPNNSFYIYRISGVAGAIIEYNEPQLTLQEKYVKKQRSQMSRRLSGIPKE